MENNKKKRINKRRRTLLLWGPTEAAQEIDQYVTQS
jgi:hypothetical protein